MKFSSKKVGKFTFDEEKLKEKSNKFMIFYFESGFKSQHLKNKNKKKDGI